MNYFNKYLKYKNKFIKLKKDLFGGDVNEEQKLYGFKLINDAAAIEPKITAILKLVSSNWSKECLIMLRSEDLNFKIKNYNSLLEKIVRDDIENAGNTRKEIFDTLRYTFVVAFPPDIIDFSKCIN